MTALNTPSNSDNPVLAEVAAALEFPEEEEGADIVWYAAHVKELCTARGQEIGRLNGMIREFHQRVTAGYEDAPEPSHV